MKIFLASTSLLPSYGGPAYSVARLAMSLAQRGADIGLWATDGSAMTSLPAGAAVRRLDGSAADAVAEFGRPDLLHDNGLWMPHNHRLATLAAAMGIARVVSTRGMLEPWALRHKPLKKSIAWRLYQRRDLQRAQTLHATSAQEARNLASRRLTVPVCVIPNGVDIPAEPAARNPACAGAPRTALFLGRIYPVKGLPTLIEAWASVRPLGWRLHIAGPDEDGHRAVLEQAVARAGLHNVVAFRGPLADEAKSAAYRSADLFVLPSLSESFGMVVAEALAHGLPVLTTTAAPWLALGERGCGWSVTPTAEGLADGLRLATAYETAALRAMGAKGRAWMAADFGWPTIADRFVVLYEQLLR